MRSRAIWLKSTKMRSPRSSFHHEVVTASGRRRSSSRAKAMTARRVSTKVQRGSIRTSKCKPRPPEVFTNGRIPSSSHSAFASWATATASAKPVPGCGSRSMRSSSGWSGWSRRIGQGCSSRVPICTVHTTVAASVRHTSSPVRPLGKVTVAVWAQAGMPLGADLVKKDLSPSSPSGKRLSATGRSRRARISGPASPA